MKEEKDEVLINNLYNSNPKAYANEGKNIVHEIINLFKANNGKHYIYIVKDGIIAEKHNDRISDILLTRSIGNKMIEIIAWVKDPKQLIKKEKNINLYEKQDEYIDEMQYDVNYKVRIDKIFEKNTYKGEKETKAIYATFSANEVVKPKESIFLTYDKNNLVYPNTYFINEKLNNQSQRIYINKNEDVFRELFKSNNWEKNNTFKKVDIDSYSRKDNNDFNFLKMIKHEYYEPAFSNMFQYYFLKNKKIFKKFAKEVLKVNINVNDEDFEIKREEHNIDILIRDKKNIIVIENKIKSGINGLKYNDYGDVVQTQLEKYINYAKCNDEDDSKEKDDEDHPHYKDRMRKPYFFIFAPNYKHLKSDKFLKAKDYKIKTYKEIYDFYKKNEKEFIDDVHFNDFLSSLKKHTVEVDSEIYDIMLDRLATRIKEIGYKE